MREVHPGANAVNEETLSATALSRCWRPAVVFVRSVRRREERESFLFACKLSQSPARRRFYVSES